jgi:hypothetical protein
MTRIHPISVIVITSLFLSTFFTEASAQNDFGLAGGAPNSAHFRKTVPGVTRNALNTGLEISELLNALPISGACTDNNTNESFALGNIRVKEPLEFVYSTFNEPELMYSQEGAGNNEVFRAIKRAIATVENAIRDPLSEGLHKEHNLFSVKMSNLPFHPSQETDNGLINHGPYFDDNYYSVLYSGDGINSIGWVDFTANGNGVIRENVGAITYTVWNEAQEIIERDIVLQANEFNSWAINADLTTRAGQIVDCSDVLDIQGVVTHMLTHAVGLRPVTDDGVAANGDESDATMWDPYGFAGLSGRIVLSNSFFGLSLPTHRWQTLTSGDKDGLVLAAPVKGDTFTPPLPDVSPEPPQVVLHYNFEEFSGGVVFDESGNGLDGIIVGAATVAVGPDGSSAINLSNGEYIDLDGPNFPRGKIPQDSYTLSVWLNIPNAALGLEPTILDTRGAFGNYSLTHFVAPPGAVMFHMTAGQTSDSTSPINQFGLIPTAIPTDVWFHYAVSYDRNAGSVSLYIDGVFAGELPLADLPISNNWLGGARIGQWLGGGSYPLRGLMDEFVLTNYAVTPEGIVDLYNGTIPTPDP